MPSFRIMDCNVVRFETEARRCAARTGHDAAAVTERFENRLPVDVLKRAGSAPSGRSNRLRTKVLH